MGKQEQLKAGFRPRINPHHREIVTGDRYLIYVSEYGTRSKQCDFKRQYSIITQV